MQINSTAVEFSLPARPLTNDGAALGDTTHNWSDLFLATGALINFNNGNVTVVHSSGILNVTVGDLRVTTPGTDAASVVTVGGTQTLTNKTLTSPVMTAPTLGVASATSVAIGSGTAITKIVKGTVTIDPASVAATTVATQTFTLTGAVVGDSLTLNIPTAGLTAGMLICQSWVSAADTISVTFYNTTGAPIDLASASWFYQLTRA